MRYHSTLTTTTLLYSTLATTISAQQAPPPSTKRGIAYLGTRYPSDYNIFLSSQSPLTWYYDWSPYPQSSAFSDLEFVPLLHNLDSLSTDLNQLKNLPSSSTHLLTFNEPDHSTSGGGSDISPPDAARAYHDQIAPLSTANGGKWLISHPSTTGTLAGLDWLRAFNESCFAINATHGCHMDFVATHFYGDFPALASWLGTLDEYYNSGSESPPYEIWITELALPQQSAEATETMLNTTLPYLDGLDYVGRYSWFGLFRPENANGWTGDGVALLDGKGRLTELGAMYLGEPFEEGLSASKGGVKGTGAVRRENLVTVVAVGLISIVLGRLI